MTVTLSGAKFRRAASWAAAGAVAMTLAGLGGASAQETIKIGVNQPLTGPVAASGNYVTNGARIAEDYVNKAGGVLGKKIELVVEDNKSNPKEAVAATEKLIVRDKVPVLMGAWSSTFTLAAMPKLMEYQVPMVVETSSSGKVTTSGNPWVFRIAPTSAMEAKAFGEKLSQFDPPIKQADFLAVNNDFGRGSSDELRKMLESKGIKTGVTELMAPDATDLSAQLAKVKQSGGDTLFVTSSVEQITLVLKQAAEQRIPQRIITAGGSSSPDQLIEHAGAAAEGSMHILFFAPWFPEKAVYPDLAKGFVDEWKTRGYEFAGLTEGFRGFDGILTITEAIRAAGKAEPAAIRDALWNVKLKGVNGDIAFIKQGPEGQESGQNQPNIYVVQVKDGKIAMP